MAQNERPAFVGCIFNGALRCNMAPCTEAQATRCCGTCMYSDTCKSKCERLGGKGNGGE